ncbi:hypothetical protein FQR65_LT20123 [Abscondita terminalis]|nr:hypothetical protein FQR65_LT20123 [Abscondita terminalis]
MARVQRPDPVVTTGQAWGGGCFPRCAAAGQLCESRVGQFRKSSETVQDWPIFEIAPDIEVGQVLHGECHTCSWCAYLFDAARTPGAGHGHRFRLMWGESGWRRPVNAMAGMPPPAVAAPPGGGR